jgi:site-specific DNA-cytosine methylase
MAAVIQGLSLGWQFYGRKTASYRQVGNASVAGRTSGGAADLKASEAAA